MLFFLSASGPSSTFSQGQYELAGYAGYQFWGGVDGILSDGTPVTIDIKASPNWGGSISCYVEESIRFELAYLNQTTTLTATNDVTQTTSDLFDITIQYFQAGAFAEAPSSGKQFATYGGLTAGVVNFNPKVTGASSQWRLSFGVTGGLKVYLSENFGFQTQASLLLPIQWSGGEIFCGGSTCNVSLKSGAALLQGAVTGGLFVDI